MKSPRELAILLRQLADLVEQLPDVDVRALLDGRSVLRVGASETPVAEVKKPRGGKSKDVDEREVMDALLRTQTRQEAMAALEASGVSRGVLERIARKLDLPVLRSDSVERLRQRIVEGVVGYRINSEAIRGRSKGQSAV